MEAWLDKAAPVRKGDEIDAEAISNYLQNIVPGLSGIAEVTQFKGGASNLTYQLDFENGISYILRKPPAGTKAKSAHDMKREFTVMKQLKPVFPALPEMIAFCDDESVLGSDFFVMEKVKGVIPRADLPKGMNLSEAETAALCKSVVDKMIELHQVDYKAAGLEALGKGNGYVNRQIRGWSDRYVKAKTDNVPDFKRVIDWLNAHIREDVATCVIHNDYRFDNVILNPQNPSEVLAVLDWEMATLGDPLMDLGNTLAYWVEASDPMPLQMLRRQPTHLPGMMTRDEVVAYYCSKMGFEAADFRFYRIYGLFRLAVIAQQIYYRFHHGQTTNPVFGTFHMMVTFLDGYCNELLDQIKD